MQKFLLLLAAISLVSVTAAAQDSSATVTFVDPGAPAPAAPPAPQISSSGFYPWQVAIGYQLDLDHLSAGPWNGGGGSTFHTNGLNFSVVRYFGTLFGLEGQIGTGFGNTGGSTTPKNITAKSVFAAGGAHFSLRDSQKVEPWVHALFGMMHYRFAQTASGLGSNTSLGYELGGGVDFHLHERIAIRAEADEFGTHFFGRSQANLHFLGGVVFNF